MTTLVAEVKALIAGGRRAAQIAGKVQALVRRIESSEELQGHFDKAVTEVNREVGQVSRAVCTALVAHALGCEPTADDVSTFLSSGVNDPAFPNRAFRLLGEARKAASHRRRAFLASMLWGLPFLKLPDDERDRVDMLVERMVLADVELLSLLVHMDRIASPSKETEPYLFRGTRLAVLTRELEAIVATTDQYDYGNNEGFRKLLDTEPAGVNRAAFGTLLTLGCIETGEVKMSQGDWTIRSLVLTTLGRSVNHAIEELRPGFENARD